MPAFLSVCLSACLYRCLCLCLSVCICLYICLSACLYMCLYRCLCLSVCLSVCIGLYICLSICLSVCIAVSVCLSVCICVCISACLSKYLRGQDEKTHLNNLLYFLRNSSTNGLLVTKKKRNNYNWATKLSYKTWIKIQNSWFAFLFNSMETRLCSRLKGAGSATHLFLFCFLTVEWFLRRESNRWLGWNTDYKYHSNFCLSVCVEY